MLTPEQKVEMMSERRRKRIADVVRSRQQGAVVLENIHDPHNAQAVFRTCDAFGIQRVCLIFEGSEPFDPRRIGKQSSSSAHKWLNFETFATTAECLDKLKAEQYEIVATVLAEDSQSIHEIELPHPRTALMLGNEHAGLTATAVSYADKKLIIPMRGMVQSLNLSVTAALCIYELTRQRLERGIEPFLFPEDKQEELELDFIKRE